MQLQGRKLKVGRREGSRRREFHSGVRHRSSGVCWTVTCRALCCPRGIRISETERTGRICQVVSVARGKRCAAHGPVGLLTGPWLSSELEGCCPGKLMPEWSLKGQGRVSPVATSGKIIQSMKFSLGLSRGLLSRSLWGAQKEGETLDLRLAAVW